MQGNMESLLHEIHQRYHYNITDFSLWLGGMNYWHIQECHEIQHVVRISWLYLQSL